MSPAHEVFTGRRAKRSTRRELLEAGAVGLAGLGLVSTFPTEAGAIVSGELNRNLRTSRSGSGSKPVARPMSECRRRGW